MPDQRSAMKEYRHLDRKRVAEGLTPDEKMRFERLRDLVAPDLGLGGLGAGELKPGFDVSAAAAELRESLIPAGLRTRARPTPESTFGTEAEWAPERLQSAPFPPSVEDPEAEQTVPPWASGQPWSPDVPGADPAAPIEPDAAYAADVIGGDEATAEPHGDIAPGDESVQGALEPPWDPNAAGYDPSAAGSYDPNAPGYYDPNAAGYDPNAPDYYDPNAAGYDPNAAAGYDPNAPGYYDPNAAGYDPNAAAGYDPNAAGYDPNAAGYDPNAAGYDPNAVGYDPNAAGYDPNAAGYDPNAAGAYDPHAPGYYDADAGGHGAGAANYEGAPQPGAAEAGWDPSELATLAEEGSAPRSLDDGSTFAPAGWDPEPAAPEPPPSSTPLGAYDEGVPDVSPAAGAELAAAIPLEAQGAPGADLHSSADFRLESGGSFAARADAAAPEWASPPGDPPWEGAPSFDPAAAQPLSDEAGFELTPAPDADTFAAFAGSLPSEGERGQAPLELSGATALEFDVDASDEESIPLLDGAELLEELTDEDPALAATPSDLDASVPPAPDVPDSDALPGPTTAGPASELPDAPFPETTDARVIPGTHRVVVHTLDGQVKRGVLEDADLGAPVLPLAPQPGGVPEDVAAEDVKAIFFMLSPGEVAPAAEGSRIRVTFHDGRQVAGFSPDYSEAASGFFIIPGDTRTNTARIWVYQAAVREVASS